MSPGLPSGTPTRRRVLPVAPRLAEREQVERARARRRRVRRAAHVLLWTTGVLLCVGLLSWLLLASPVLAVSTVQVTGARQVSAEDVRAAAAVRTGTPLARVDLGAVRARVSGLGPVARVRVVRAWPHTLRLTVSERAAVGMVASPGGWSLVDATGTRYSPSPEPPPGLPQLTDAAGADVTSQVQVLADLPVALRDQVARVEQPSPSSVVLVLRDGRTVVWGSPGRSAQKAAVVTALLGRPGKVFDVTTPDVAVVREH